MNTYDFDKTIFPTDSGFLFIRYCAGKYPHLFIGHKRKMLGGLVKYLTGKINIKEFKETAFSFLGRMEDIDRSVNDFWEINYGKVQDWYLKRRRDSDVIISASPEFLIRPVAQKLGVSLIATRMDKKTGRIDGLNCHDSEKVNRFYALYPGGHSECFFSDSLADTPMALISDRAFLIKKGKVYPWPKLHTD